MSHHQLCPHHFQINLTSPSGSCFGFITLDGNKLLHLDDVEGFYSFLGFTVEHKRAGVTPEEYLWLEYRKDHCNKSYVCLQLKIIDYLSQHFPTFEENYAEKCKYWIDCCIELSSAKLPMCFECKKYGNVCEKPMPTYSGNSCNASERIF